MSMVEALNLALDQALHDDSKVFLLGEDIGLTGGVMGVTKSLAEKYGTTAFAIRRSQRRRSSVPRSAPVSTGSGR